MLSSAHIILPAIQPPIQTLLHSPNTSMKETSCSASGGRDHTLCSASRGTRTSPLPSSAMSSPVVLLITLLVLVTGSQSGKLSLTYRHKFLPTTRVLFPPGVSIPHPAKEHVHVFAARSRERESRECGKVSERMILATIGPFMDHRCFRYSCLKTRTPIPDTMAPPPSALRYLLPSLYTHLEQQVGSQ